MRIALSLCLCLALISCSTSLTVYKNVHIAQVVIINKETLAFRTYDRLPIKVDSTKYDIARIQRMKQTRKGIVWIDCITKEKSTIRLVLNN